MIKTKIKGSKKLQAKVQDIRVYFKGEYTSDVIDEVYTRTKKIIPRYRGNLVRAFRKVIRKNTGSLVQMMPKQNRLNPRPYHLWLNGTGNPGYSRSDGTRGNININAFMARRRSGKPMYMKIAAEDLKRTAKRVARKKLNSNNK